MLLAEGVEWGRRELHVSSKHQARKKGEEKGKTSTREKGAV